MLSSHKTKLRKFQKEHIQHCQKLQRMKSHVVMASPDALLDSLGSPLCFLVSLVTFNVFLVALTYNCNSLVKATFMLLEQLCWHAQRGERAWNLPSPTSHPEPLAMAASWRVWKPSFLALGQDNSKAWFILYNCPVGLCLASSLHCPTYTTPLLFLPGALPLACESSL